MDAVTDYQIAKVMTALYLRKSFEGQEIDRIQRDAPDRQAYRSHLNGLIKSGVLKPIQNERTGLYALLDRKNISAQDIACIADPFAYIAYLSAMVHHGITDKLPNTLHLCTLPSRNWRENAETLQQKELGYSTNELKAMGLPPLRRIAIRKYGRTNIYQHETVHHGGFINISDRPIRVASIGRTFLDMLRRPDLCGGMGHVINVFKEYATQYKKLIILELDQHGSKIDKVRAGYILNEIMDILDSTTMEKWLACTQRGGSQKLDPQGEYYHEFSDKWCLSINLPLE